VPNFFSFLVQESKILYWLTVGERGTLSERTTDDDERQTRVERRMYLYYAYTHVDSIILLSLTSCLSLYLYLDRLDSIRGYEPNYNYYSCSLLPDHQTNALSVHVSTLSFEVAPKREDWSSKTPKMAKSAMTPLDTRSTSPERAVQPLVQTDTPRLISPKNNLPIVTSTSKAMAATVKPAEWKEVTMSASFKDLHTVAFPIIQFLLQQPVNRDHPFRTAWNDYLDCGKGITKNSSFYAVKMITGIKNIDKYKNLMQKCPQLKEYLAIKRADPKYSSKIIFRVLKLPSKTKERIDVDLAMKETPSKAKKRIDVDLATKETPVDPSATIQSVNAPAELPPSDTDKGPASSTSRVQLKATGDIPKSHIRISLYPNDQSFEKFLYQAYPYITSWCTDKQNCNTVFAQKWNRAIEHGLSPLSSWEFVFELLEIK